MKNIQFFLLAVIGMTGCNLYMPSPVFTETIPIKNTVDTLPTVTLALTLTPSPSLPPTNTPGVEEKTSCLKVNDEETSLQNVAKGAVLLNKSYVDKVFYESLYILDLNDGIENPIPAHTKSRSVFEWDTSPDRNLLAVTEEIRSDVGQFEKTILRIVNPEAKVLKETTFLMPDLYNMHWLNDQSLIFHLDRTKKDGTVLFFNPFTREQRYIYNELPDFYQENRSFFNTYEWLIDYSPDLKWGVYLGYVENEKLGFIVRDFVNKQNLWQMKDYLGEYQKPAWSPDGNQVAIVADGQLYIVDHGGNANLILPENQFLIFAKRPTWSPDGHYIAFWNNYDLMLYDIQADELYDLCYENEDTPPIIWSPDSKQFAIPALIGQNPKFADIPNKTLYSLSIIPDTIYPTGWMYSNP